MASAGTIASPLVDALKFTPHPGRQGAIVMGRVVIKSTANIDAGDIELRTIKSAVVTLYNQRTGPGGLSALFGSVNNSGSLSNTVHLRVLRGSSDIGWGTTHQGTIAGGTMKIGFIIQGA